MLKRYLWLRHACHFRKSVVFRTIYSQNLVSQASAQIWISCWGQTSSYSFVFFFSILSHRVLSSFLVSFLFSLFFSECLNDLVLVCYVMVFCVIFFVCFFFFFSRLWAHHSTVWCGESIFHCLCLNWCPLHHAGADGMCAAPDDAVKPATSGLLASAVWMASSHCQHRALCPPAPADHCVVLFAASYCFQHHWGLLVISGGFLFLLHLPLHHWVRRFRPRGAA